MATLLSLINKWDQGRKTEPNNQSEQALTAVEDAGAAAGAIAGLMGPTSR